MSEIFYRNLPHYHLPNATYFITFRLGGSLPVEDWKRLKEEYEQEKRLLANRFQGRALQDERYKSQKQYFARIDALLDRAQIGPHLVERRAYCRHCHPTDTYLHPDYYHLHAYCLMSNHVHLLIDQQDIPDPPPRKDGKHYTALRRAMRQLKSKSGYACTQGLRGDFWQHESYDHVVRNEKEHEQILAYILNNPVKAGLVKDWQEWP